MKHSPIQSRPRRMFCGPMGLEWRSLFRLHANNTLPTWYDHKHIIYFHKARAGIKYACQLLGIKPGDKVLAPSYNCGVEVDPILKSGAAVTLYRQDKTGQIDVNDIESRIDAHTRIIYVNQYFGFPQPLERVRRICDAKGIYLIEDCALSLFSKDNHAVPLGSTGDLAIFNLYKTLPLPDGGALMVNNPDLLRHMPAMHGPPRKEVLIELLKLCKNHLLYNIPGANALYGSIKRLTNRSIQDAGQTPDRRKTFPDMPASYYYDENLSLRSMSRLSQHLLERCDYEKVVQQRRKHFRKYLHGLRGAEHIEFLHHDLPEGVCPLHFPIFVDDPDTICKEMYQHSVILLHWWSGYHRDLSYLEFPEACRLKDHLLALPVHQQLQDKHIDHIIRHLLRVTNGKQGSR